ncbi:unknown [Crocosphaera subtropica ATCC 51142]|uniref:Uncharacterized protein n=1 Tax=Crocosphaera subtropica (strain ATCC 51142 / BH68) TaxID=43989 RepID=B1WW55_CROS5|nr:hypothetical protein [Crocosphaera subtropica]ACB53983.1 unknown [Crocosphaera subtropica ATCC 51142]
MFGRQPKEENSTDNIEVPDIMFPSESELEEASQDDTELSKITNRQESSIDEENPEVVTIVERISAIVSPYFIVVVGLILSDDNFWLGLLLIAVGILSLLKISLTDIVGLFIEIKEGFTSDD